MNLNRRSFMKLAAGGMLCAGLSPFVGMPVLAKAKPTVKTYTFSARQTTASLGNETEFTAWTYNGQLPGPEIRVTEGDIIRVVLKNELPEATTIHWHGIPLPNAMDGVPTVTQKPIQPGESFVYEFEAKPAGTFLYHSHVKYQLDQGLYGALIIEPKRSTDSYDQEYSLVLEDWVMRDGGGTADVRRRPPMGMMRGRMHRRPSSGPKGGPLWEPVYDGYAVNGRIRSAIKPLKVSHGDRIKLRLINAASSSLFYLRLAGHTLSITHADGIPVRPISTDVLRIGMGERYDIMIKANNPGSWMLAAYDSGWGEGQLQIPFVYKGYRQKDAESPVFHRDLRLVTYGNLEALYPSAVSPEAPTRVYHQMLGGGMHSSRWSINGFIYPQAENLVVNPDDIVRLRYENHSPMPHPMHLHGHFFRIVNRRLPKEKWVLKDTLIIDHMQGIEVEFVANNPGNWLHHCHNLYHMEAGMANTVNYQKQVT